MFKIKADKFMLKVAKFQLPVVYRFSTAENMAVGGFHDHPRPFRVTWAFPNVHSL